MARRRVACGEAVRQLVLPGYEALVRRSAQRRGSELGGDEAVVAVGEGDARTRAEADWEERCFAEGCAEARRRAVTRLVALEAWLHTTRPVGYQGEGWRERTLVTRMGDLRVQRRLYRDRATGRTHCLFDAQLGWTAHQAASPAFLALLVDWATDMSFEDASRRLAAATAGVLSGATVRRRVRQVAERVRVAEHATHQLWTTTGRSPEPAGTRVVAPRYVEADGVWVKTQREPAHPTGYELKCGKA